MTTAHIEPQPETAMLDMEMPVARIRGEPMTELPADLYIPPDALAIILEQF